MNSANIINLTVTTPAGVYEGRFRPTATVRQVIEVIVKEKGLAEGDAFELTLDGRVLGFDERLARLPLEDGTVLDLIASGSGV